MTNPTTPEQWAAMNDADKARAAAKDVREAMESVLDDCDCASSHVSGLGGIPEWLEELAVKLETS